MALDNFKCDNLMPLHFTGLSWRSLKHVPCAAFELAVYMGVLYFVGGGQCRTWRGAEDSETRSTVHSSRQSQLPWILCSSRNRTV